MKRLTIFALAIGLATSPSIAFHPDPIARLKSKPVCPDCDLSGAAMEDAYLPGAILTNANLEGADLKGANLKP